MSQFEFMIFSAIAFFGTLKWSDRFFEISICTEDNFNAACDELKELGLITGTNRDKDEYLLTSKGRVHNERMRALCPPKVEMRWVDADGNPIKTSESVEDAE